MNRKLSNYAQSSRRTPICGGSRIPRRSSSTPSIPCLLGPMPATEGRGGLLQSLRKRRSSSNSCMDRLSMGRPSMAAGKRPAVKDSRPLADREYQRECAERLHEFLTSHGFTCQVSVQQLLRMSNKLYAECFMFLMKFLDPGFTLGGKMEENVMNALQFLGYPYSISKSMLQAIGSRLPLALGTLTWLLEVVMYSEQTDVVKHLFGGDGIPGMGDSLPLGPLVEFGLQAKNLSDEEKDAFVQKLVEDTHGPLESLDDLQQELDRYEKELVQREADVASYNAVAEEIASMKASIEQVDQFLQRMEGCHKQRLQQLEATKAQADAKQLEVENLKKELQVLQATLDGQKQRGEDQQSVRDRHEWVRAEVQQAQELLQAQREKRREMELELSALLDKNRSENIHLNKLYGEARQLCISLSVPGSSTLKEFEYAPTTSIEDLQEMGTIFGVISEAAAYQVSKVVANTKREKELIKNYLNDIREVQSECKTERELWDQAVASHEALKQDLLAQYEEAKEEYARIMKETLKAESEAVAIQSKDPLLSLQQRVDAAKENSLEQCRKYEETKAECEKRVKDVEEIMKVCHARLIQNFKQLQEIVEQQNEFKRNFKAPWTKSAC